MENLVINWYGLWRNWCEDFEAWIFCFHSFISSSLSHRKNCTVKMGLGESYFTFPKWCQTYTLKPLRVKPLEIFSIADAFASDSGVVHLVAGEFGHVEELGVRQCDLPKSEEIECPDEFESSNSDRCCAACQLSSGSLSWQWSNHRRAFMTLHVGLPLSINSRP